MSFPDHNSPLPPTPHPGISPSYPSTSSSAKPTASSTNAKISPTPAGKPAEKISNLIGQVADGVKFGTQELKPQPSTSSLNGDFQVKSSPPKTLNKVEYQALKLWASVSKKGKKEHDDYVKKHIQYRSQISADHTEALTAKESYKPNVNNAGEYLSIDVALPKGVKRTPFHAHTAAAKSGLSNRSLYETVKDKAVEGLGILKAHGFKEGKFQSGTIFPTSNWLGNEKKREHNHLMNVYIIRPNGEKTAVIRSSKIDTKEKADEFLQLLQNLCVEIRNESGNENYQLRVVSEQLNSFDFGRESQMINDQHIWMSYANQQLKDARVGELVHISIPANTFYFVTKQVRKLGIVGKLLEKHAFNGEMRSKDQNLDSWGTYVRWTTEKLQATRNELEEKNVLNEATTLNGRSLTVVVDEYIGQVNETSEEISELQSKVVDLLEKGQATRDELPGLKQKLKEAKQTTGIDKQSEIAAATKKLKQAEAALKENRKDLKPVRRDLRIKLETHHQQLSELDSKLRDASENLPEGELARGLTSLRQPISLMSQVLGSQLGIPTGRMLNSDPQTASRGREILMLQALHDELGIVSAGNCKSGLDRTGIWHAVVLAMKQMKKIAQLDVFPMVDEWDVTTRELNIRSTEMEPDAFAEWLMTDEVEVGREGYPINKETCRQIIELRKMVLDNIMLIGLPITERSTGLQGMKWSPGGVGENLIPLNFLPSHAVIDGETVALVKYGKKGQVKGLTAEGTRVLAKFEDIRAS